MNASSLMMLSLTLGAGDHPSAAPATGPVVVNSGAGCNGCGTATYGPVVAHSPCNPCNPCGGQHATLVDWVKSKTNGSGRPGLFSRFRKADKPAAGHVVAAAPCCDPCAAGVAHHHGTVVHPGATVPPPAAGGTTTTPGGVIPKDMPKPKDPPKTDPPKTDPPKNGNGGKPADPPKNPPGSVSIPPIPTAPVTGASGTNSPY